MAVTSELRPEGDLDRFDLDAADLEGLVPVAAQPATQHDPAGMTVIDDRPIDLALWAGAADENLDGYYR